MYVVAAEKAHDLLRARLWGFFAPEDVADFSIAAQDAVQRMGCRSGDWMHLCDVSGLKLQRGDVADAFGRFINAPELRSRKLAIVTGDSPVKMQIRRLLRRSDSAVFVTIDEAERWLFDDCEQRLSA